MDALDNIFGRRSIRKYTNKPVAKDDVRKLLEAGMHAPTAKNIQPWHFIVIDRRELLDELSVAHPYATMLKQASLAILVCGDRHLQDMDGYLVQDCSAATQNIMLAAHALGLGSVWLGMYPREDRMYGMGKLLKVPAHILPVALISIGYPDETRPAPDRYNNDRIHYNKF